MNGSIRKRGKNTWELTVDLGRDGKGKRIRRYQNVKGTKTQAQRSLRDLLVSLDHRTPIDNEKVSLGDWMSQWMIEYVVPNTRQKTVERYRGIIDRHIVPALGHLRLIKVAPRDIRFMEAKLLDSGMSPKGVEMVHTVISGAYKYALRMDVAWRNPAKAVTPPKLEVTEVTPPDISEVKQILALAEAAGDALFPALRLIAYTGLRRGEALGIRNEDINLDAGTISVVQSIGRSVDKGVITEPTKTHAGRRAVDLDGGTIDVLRAHIGNQLLSRLEMGEIYQDHGLLFPNSIGEPLNPMTLTRRYQRYAHQLGITGARLHDLRHFHASVMLQSGASLLLVSRRLGHASIATTGDVYGHLVPGAQKQAAEAFAKLMNQGYGGF